MAENIHCDDECIVSTREGIKDYVGRHADKAAMPALQLARGLKAGKRKVFFYAICDFDWQPLHRFTHLCDTFVYVDPRAEEINFNNSLRRTNADAGLAIYCEPSITPKAVNDTRFTRLTGVFRELSELHDEPWSDIRNLDNQQGWGKVIKFKRKVGGVDRIKWLIYIKGSPLTAYRKLFIDNGSAPEILAIGKAPYHNNAAPGINEDAFDGWQKTFSWDGELGQMLRAGNAPLPKMIAAEEILAWPVNPYRYRIREWGVNQYGWISPTGGYGWPYAATATEPGRRHIAITRKYLTPQDARAYGAVVVSFETYCRYAMERWPENTLIIHNPPMLPPEPEPEEPPFIPPPNEAHLNLAGMSLLQSLRAVEAICAERGITSVAFDYLPGFEDEADALVWWRRQKKGQIKKLALYVECAGHYLDFAGAADVLD